ncbi:MAG: hypothetical protein WB949_07780 [Candidatus Acidiferrales bacterium]
MIRRPRSAGIAVLSLCSFVWAGSFHLASAQSPANASNPPSTQDSADKKPDKAAEDRGSSGQAATPAQPKKPKVITNDDINADRARHNDGFAGGRVDTHAIPGTGVCDDDCAEQARQMTEFGPDRDGEWRFALTAARRNLAADTAWPGAYATLARAMKTYCTFQEQLETTAVPSGNDYGARVERARREKYAEDMGRVLGQTVNNANAQIDRMAQQADDSSDPARGAIMRVLAQRVNNSCDP